MKPDRHRQRDVDKATPAPALRVNAQGDHGPAGLRGQSLLEVTADCSPPAPAAAAGNAHPHGPASACLPREAMDLPSPAASPSTRASRRPRRHRPGRSPGRARRFTRAWPRCPGRAPTGQRRHGHVATRCGNPRTCVQGGNRPDSTLGGGEALPGFSHPVPRPAP